MKISRINKLSRVKRMNRINKISRIMNTSIINGQQLKQIMKKKYNIQLFNRSFY